MTKNVLKASNPEHLQAGNTLIGTFPADTITNIEHVLMFIQDAAFVSEIDTPDDDAKHGGQLVMMCVVDALRKQWEELEGRAPDRA